MWRLYALQYSFVEAAPGTGNFDLQDAGEAGGERVGAFVGIVEDQLT